MDNNLSDFKATVLQVEIVLIGIPLITFIISRFLARNKRFAVNILIISCVMLGVGLLCYISKITFVNLDWDIYAGIIMFIFLCLIIWIIPIIVNDRILKVFIQAILIIPILFFFILATVGILGALWIVDDFKPGKVFRLTETLTYKEFNSGMAFTGPRIDIIITKRLDNFGIFEREITSKVFESMESSYNDIEVKFENGNLYLETFPDSSSTIKEKFIDSIRIGHD